MRLRTALWIGSFCLLAAAGAQAAPVISYVKSYLITADEAYIQWLTDTTADDQVDYGTTLAYGTSSPIKTGFRTHVVHLTGLTPNTLYHYQVKSDDGTGLTIVGDNTFHTFPLPGTGTIEVSLFEDLDGDGVKDPGEGYIYNPDFGAACTGSDVGIGGFTTYGNGVQVGAWGNFDSCNGSNIPVFTYPEPVGQYHVCVQLFGAQEDWTLTSGPGISSNNAFVDIQNGGSSALAFAVRPAQVPDTTPPVVSGVFASDVWSTSATVNRGTNENATSTVEYGTDTSYGSIDFNLSLGVCRSHVLTGLLPNTLYHYRFITQDAAGNSTTSGDFTFTTQQKPPTPPSLISPPQDITVAVGEDAPFSVNADGDLPLTYQWQSKPPAGAFGNVGTNSPNFTFTSAVLANSGTQFRCIVTNATGTVTSAAATLTVSNIPAVPIFTPSGGVFISSVQVTLHSVTPGTSIYYTLDGSNPTLGSALYTGPLTLSVTTTVKAFSYLSGNSSAITSATFTQTGGGSLPLPDLSGLPAFASLNDGLTIPYNPSFRVSFSWTFTPTTLPGYSQRRGSSSQAPGAFPVSFMSGAQTASLASYGLTLGDYQVSVYTVDVNNSANTSNTATRTITLVVADFSQMRVYPSPWRSDRHSGKDITFDMLPIGSTVKIFTVSGHLVKTLTPAVDTVSWNLRNESGDLVASGIYLYLITTGDSGGYGGVGQTARGKFGIVR